MGTRTIKAVFANYVDEEGNVLHASRGEEVELTDEQEKALDEAGALYSTDEDEAAYEQVTTGVVADPRRDQIDEGQVKRDVRRDVRRAELRDEAQRKADEKIAEAEEKIAEEEAKREEEELRQADADSGSTAPPEQQGQAQPGSEQTVMHDPPPASERPTTSSKPKK